MAIGYYGIAELPKIIAHIHIRTIQKQLLVAKRTVSQADVVRKGRITPIFHFCYEACFQRILMNVVSAGKDMIFAFYFNSFGFLLKERAGKILLLLYGAGIGAKQNSNGF